MSDVTFSEFAGFVNQALHRLKREWSQGHRRAPDDFPERMTLDQWWARFSTIDAPETILGAIQAEADRAQAKEHAPPERRRQEQRSDRQRAM